MGIHVEDIEVIRKFRNTIWLRINNASPVKYRLATPPKKKAKTMISKSRRVRKVDKKSKFDKLTDKLSRCSVAVEHLSKESVGSAQIKRNGLVRKIQEAVTNLPCRNFLL